MIKHEFCLKMMMFGAEAANKDYRIISEVVSKAEALYDEHLSEAIADQEIKEGEKAVLDVDFNNSSVVTVVAIGDKKLMATITDGEATWDVMFSRLFKITKP